MYNGGVAHAHAKLPKWMRHNVKTLRDRSYHMGRNEIVGGWKNLKVEMKQFFEVAKSHSELVLKQQMESFHTSQSK